MNADVVDLAKRVRMVYRRCYVPYVERAKEGDVIRMQAHVGDGEETSGFPDCDIVASFGAPRDDRIWAANVIRELDSGAFRGFILVNPSVLELGRVMRNFVLAEEFLQVAIGFEDPTTRTQRRTVAGRVDLVELYNTLCRRTLWQDSPDDQIEMQRGLRYLLVPTEEIVEALRKQFGLPLGRLQSVDANTTSAKERKEAKDLLGKLERAIADDRNVDPKLVRDRIDEVLGELT